jgi:hypothetical protein
MPKEIKAPKIIGLYAKMFLPRVIAEATAERDMRKLKKEKK